MDEGRELPEGVPVDPRDRPMPLPRCLLNNCVFIIFLVLAGLLVCPFLLVLLLVLLPLWCIARSWEKTYVSKLCSESSIADTELGPIEYVKLGSAPYCLWIPGGSGGFDQMGAEKKTGFLVDSWLKEGVGIIAVSRPGFLRTPLTSGRSTKGRDPSTPAFVTTPAEQADLCAALLDVLGVKSVAVCGRSGAGPIAAEFAARHPEKTAGLLLFYCNTYPCGPAPSEGGQRRDGSTPLIVPFAQIFAFSTLAAWFGKPAPVPEAYLEPFTDMVLKMLSNLDAEERKKEAERLLKVQEFREVLLSGDAAKLGFPSSARADGIKNDFYNQAWSTKGLPFSNISCPTIIAHGKRDCDVPPAHSEHAHKQIKDSKLFLFENAYHGCDCMLDPEYDALHPTVIELCKRASCGRE